MTNDLSERLRRDGTADLEVAVARREFYRLTPEGYPLPPSLTLPAYAVPIRTTTAPTRSVLRAVETGLLQRWGQ